MPPADFGLAFAIGIVLNLPFILVEAGYGIMAGSLALVVDAGHNMTATGWECFLRRQR